MLESGMTTEGKHNPHISVIIPEEIVSDQTGTYVNGTIRSTSPEAQESALRLISDRYGSENVRGGKTGKSFGTAGINYSGPNASSYYKGKGWKGNQGGDPSKS